MRWNERTKERARETNEERERERIWKEPLSVTALVRV